MMKPENTDKIVHSIYKRILGTITTEESQDLEEWRKAKSANDRLYQRLLDTAFLEREYRRMKAVNPTQALADMQARIGHGHKSVWNGRWYAAVAAAVLLVFGLWTVLHFRLSPLPALTEQEETGMYAARIQPGKTKAILIFGDGKVVQLGSDSTENKNLIRQKERSEKPTVKKQLNRLATPRGGEFKITLEDGTEVWLNAESQLSYPDTFRTNERRVILKGEAYFKVTKNEQKPFYVESDGQLVRVWGTEFNIRSYPEDPEVYTTLVSGSVTLQPANGTNAELSLLPDHQAVFDKNDASTFIRTVDTEVVTSWRKGMFVFENQSLEQIMRTLSRWYDFAYEFQDRQVSETVFMGSIPRYSDFKEVLEILEKSGGLKFSMKERTVIVTRY